MKRSTDAIQVFAMFFHLLLTSVFSANEPIRVDNRSGKQCVDYILDLVSGIAGRTKGAVRIDGLESIETYLEEIASGAAAEFYRMLVDRNRNEANLLGRSVRILETEAKETALLCYLRGRCALKDVPVFFPLVFEDYGATMLFTALGGMRPHRPSSISASQSHDPVLFFSTPAIEDRSDFGAVVSTLGEIAKLTGWLELSSAAKAPAVSNSTFQLFLSQDEAGPRWETGFVFVYLTLRSMMVKILALTELYDITLVEEDTFLETTLEKFQKEAAALIRNMRPATDQAIEHFGLFDGKQPVNLVAKAVNLQRKLEEVLANRVR